MCYVLDITRNDVTSKLQTCPYGLRMHDQSDGAHTKDNSLSRYRMHICAFIKWVDIMRGIELGD